MSGPVTRFLRIGFITVIAVIFLVFSVANREFIDISFFPLPYHAGLPTFLLVIICFTLGALVGGGIGIVKLAKAKRLYKTEHAHNVTLQNEVQALHVAQSNHLPAVIPAEI